MPSSSLDVPQIKYDVFISFRGEDIRDNFLSHLRKELRHNQIDFFVDDEKVHPGDEISSTLLEAIEGSYISLVIFSKHYASSKWCMEELVRITECMEEYERIVIPVFYNVDPSHVRHQKGTFAEAFDVHEEKYKISREKLQNWRSVLKKIANLSGIHYPSKYRNESEVIDDIVKSISEKLPHLLSNASEGLIGIDENSKFLQPLLEMESDEVRIVGIWGMGGIGKTTIARAIFDRYASRYEGCCFLQNVREESQNSGKHGLYEKLISELLEEEHLLVKGSAQARSMYVKRRLSRKKVFIVLDDVDTSDILDYLIIKQICLAPGSRVIITTRDEQVLIAARVHAIYKVQELSFKSSLELFCLKAFHKSYPENGYEKLSKMAVNYANGIPLALEVLGSFLCSRSVVAWESALRKLKIHPDPSIFKVLKLSYDGLDELERSIFLDIAFFFKGECMDDVIRFLDSCDFFAEIGINNLERKALITIRGKRIEMHDLIQQMGWEIVRQESNTDPGKSPKINRDPGKLSRLSRPEDFYNLLKNSQENKLVEGIMIDLSQTKDLHLNANTFKNMPRLRFLKLHTLLGVRSSNVLVPTGLEAFSDELRYLEWCRYPLSSLPSTFFAEKLVEFSMPQSQVSKLWDGVQDLVNLKIINLSQCNQLVELPDLSKATNLEVLDVSFCKGLCELHPSVLSIPTLKNLSLSWCQKLNSVKGEIHSKSLKRLDFGGCSSLEEFSVTSGELSCLYFIFSRIKSLPNELCGFITLEELNLACCSELIELPHNLKAFSRLKSLTLNSCSSLRYIPELPPSIEKLFAADCTSLESIFSLKEVFSLNRRRISFTNCMRLDKESLNDIIEDAHHTIFRNMLLWSSASSYGSWVPDEDDWDSRFNCDVCHAGSSVPEWFRCQRAEGASVTVEIEQPYYQLLGFCFCCVLSQEFSDDHSILCEYDLGDGVKYPGGSFMPFGVGKRWISDRVLLWFNLLKSTRILRDIEKYTGSDDHGTTCNQTITFRFSAKTYLFEQEDPVIKECGVFPIYASDVLDLIARLELEFDLNPHHKSAVWKVLGDWDLDALKSRLIQKIKEKSICFQSDSIWDSEEVSWSDLEEASWSDSEEE
ncbi:hypothetical protein HN51_048753 [Arachis hypogaea]|uniref:disease resistance protein RPV1 isoform X2 n=1 Tax=Arachis hypogaea TaxID=3818 RepID=UPI000DECB527|nr:disease resistance protein RML1B isoform X2 [Arachis hypogaea]